MENFLSILVNWKIPGAELILRQNVDHIISDFLLNDGTETFMEHRYDS